MIVTSYSLHDVFTPTKPARATFVDRPAVNDKLVRALQTPGKQIVLYGLSGCGKSTLLVNKLDQVYEHHITTRCTQGITFDQILLDAFDQLDRYYEETFSQRGNRRSGVSIGTDFHAIKAELRANQSDSEEHHHSRVLPPQLTPQNLARFLGEARCCWVLEDFHKTNEASKTRLAQLMKVFMDMADTYDSVKIIGVGAVHTARQVVEYDEEMRNRVSEIHVPLMEPAELTEIISKGEALLNLEVNPDIKERICEYSNGLASVCHQLCLNLCYAADITQTTPGPAYTLSSDQFEQALQYYVEDASDTIRAAFDKAQQQRRTKRFRNGTLILTALATFPQEGATRSELFRKIRDGHPDYPQGNLTRYLELLQSDDYGGTIRQDESTGKIVFRDPFYRVYAVATLQQQRAHARSMPSFEQEIIDLFSQIGQAGQEIRRLTISKGGKTDSNNTHE